MALEKIISGGQTGVDRGALDAALEASFPCGGWCPQGRAAEDGAIPARYPLAELAGAGYAERTAANVRDSDGTAIIHHGALEGGTLQTRECCVALGKPHLLVDAARRDARRAGAEIATFVAGAGIRVLNVAGPRQSKWPGAHAYARAAIREALRRLGQNERRS
ncbi:MAG TPA: putative molybdenum carrier protein [Burkholderiales bacterium]|nr:putative molybdenum carrier protein [Burkholderiales bacterium]